MESTLTKSCVYAIYRNMMPDEYKYDYANFSNALYDWIYIEVFKVQFFLYLIITIYFQVNK